MTREQAINYLISSGFTHEQVGEVVRALTYEPTTKNNSSELEKNSKKLEKDFDELDCISRKAVLDLIADYDLSMGQVVKGVHALPSVTPQLSVPEVTALAEWTEKLTKASEDAYNKGYADGMKEQEPQKFRWCTDCREYDQEKHCCHRWSKVIRDTVEEMKQEQEPRKGHWLHRPHVYGVAYCSICDFELKIDNTNYCPNCGCKMEDV